MYKETIENIKKCTNFAISFPLKHRTIELSKVFARFIRNYGEVEAECIGARYNRGEGKGLEFPVDYKLSGNKRYLEKLVSSIKKKETTCNLNISEVRECQDRNS